MTMTAAHQASRCTGFILCMTEYCLRRARLREESAAGNNIFKKSRFRPVYHTWQRYSGKVHPNQQAVTTLSSVMMPIGHRPDIGDKVQS